MKYTILSILIFIIGTIGCNLNGKKSTVSYSDTLTFKEGDVKIWKADSPSWHYATKKEMAENKRLKPGDVIINGAHLSSRADPKDRCLYVVFAIKDSIVFFPNGFPEFASSQDSLAKINHVPPDQMGVMMSGIYPQVLRCGHIKITIERTNEEFENGYFLGNPNYNPK